MTKAEKEKLIAEREKQWEELFRFQVSEENRVACIPFVLECQRMTEIGETYAGQVQIIYDKLTTESARVEYSKGGTIHRGYYCPSPTQDIVVGRTDRGRLLKRVTAATEPDYRYWFNADGQLVAVDSYFDFSKDMISLKEIILYQDGKELGILFSVNSGMIIRISECTRRNGQLISYSIIASGFPAYCEYNREDYCYTEDRLSTVDWYTFTRMDAKTFLSFSNSLYGTNESYYPNLQHYRYTFIHDEEGYLSKYTSSRFKSTGECIGDDSESDVPSKIKRRV